MKRRFFTWVLAGGLLAGAPSPVAWADDVDLGGTADVDIVDIEIEQHWTVDGLRPSTDSIPYRPVGTLWEANASVTLDQGGVPVVSSFAARSPDANYPALWNVASPLGIPPNALPPGGSANGKIYFDVTGDAPTSVAYSINGADAATWG